VRELGFAILTPREYLVRRKRYGPGVFLLARVLGDVVRMERGLVEDLAPPLFHGCQAGGKHERRLPDEFHRRKADDGFAGAAWKHDHSAAASFRTGPVKRFGRLLLVVTHRKRPS
jgi:hypothetical protein